MADGTGIQWCDATWPIVQGCDPVSPGCACCYVPKELWRMMHNPDPRIAGPIAGTAKRVDGATKFTGKVVLREDRLGWPLAWRKPRMIFVPSHGDIFHDAVPDEFIDKIFGAMGACDDAGIAHIFQVLTKRARRMRDYMRNRAHKAWNARRLGTEAFPPRNIWLGVSVERQEEAAERIPILLDTPAVVRWISREPGLGPVDFGMIVCGGGEKAIDALQGCHAFRDVEGWEHAGACARIDWVVDGGESGSDRPFDLDASRALEAQCVDARVAYFRKQLGSRPFERTPSAWPNGAPHGDGSLRLTGDGFGRYFVSGFKHKKAGDPA